MRIKTYIAPSVPEAMDTIRKDFGSSAMILSNQRTLEGVRITVGLEDASTEAEVSQALFGSRTEQSLCLIEKALSQQSIPPLLIERLLLIMKNKAPDLSQQDLLTEALQEVFNFSALVLQTTKKAYMLTGPYGSGKAIAAAKMAVRAKVENKKLSVITTDVKRAGAIEQLEAFTKILELPLIKVRKPDLLKSAVEEARKSSDLIIIDSPGVNPFLQKDMSLLQQMRSDIDGFEAILVLPAGLDSYETAQMAEAFLPLGCSRIMATRLDLSRRFGNILFAAQNNGYALTDVGMGTHVYEGLCPLKASSLAELILLTTKKEGLL